ncbi:MAG: hypothetical protein ACJ8G3_03050 [Burkholderiaceae bacterium]
MGSFQKIKFVGGKVKLNGNGFIECEFIGCILEFLGTGTVLMDGCVFNNAKWSFVGTASNTLQFLAAMANDLGEDGYQIVEYTFAQILGRDRAATIVRESPTPAV